MCWNKEIVVIIVFVIVNQKGGVGKIISSVNLVVFLVVMCKKVLLVDIDLQGNVISGVGVDKYELEYIIYDVLMGEVNVEDVVVDIFKDFGFDLIVVNGDLIVVEVQLLDMKMCEFCLCNVLVCICVNYDYIIVDCLLLLNMFIVNVFIVVDLVIVLIQCEYYVLEGFILLMNIIEKICIVFNFKLYIGGLLCIMYDLCNSLFNDVFNQLISYFGDKVYCIIIFCNVWLVEVFSYGVLVIIYDFKFRGVVSYLVLVGEILWCEQVM